MSLENFLFLILAADLTAFSIAFFISRKLASQRAFNAAYAFAIAFTLAPGLIFGHGVALLPAFVAMVLQPSTAPLNAIPFIMVYGIAFLILSNRQIFSSLWPKRQNKSQTPYNWACHVCQTSNSGESKNCCVCGHPSAMSGKEINEARARFKNST